MNNFYLTTDATLDLTQEMIDEVGLKVIPMNFVLGRDEYRHYPDGRELSYEDFYTRLKNGDAASTSQISPITYEEFFVPMLEEGKDIIYVCLSSGLSGTFGASQIVARELMERYPERKITCIDSLCASIGEGLLVFLAARKMNEGASYEDVVGFLTDTKLSVDHCFMVEDLNQLKRGGRISSFEAVLGSALQIHPILSIDSEGKLHVISKARGVKKSLHFIKEYFLERSLYQKEATCIIGHANCPEYAEFLYKSLVDEGLCKEAFITKVGPVIGSHVGQGMCALTFVSKASR